MRHTILLFILCLNFKGYAGSKEVIKPILIEDLKSNKIIDTAIPSSINRYFNMMLHGCSKKYGGCPEYLFANSDFVYYGYPFLNDNNQNCIYNYYKVSKKDLTAVLPGYTIFSFPAIDKIVDKCWDTVYRYYDSLRKEGYPTQSVNKGIYDVKIQDAYIEVNKTYKVKHIFFDFITVSRFDYTIYLDKKTLQIVKTKKIIKNKA